MEETPGVKTKAPYVFVCYAHDDTALVFPYVEWLQKHGVECWYDRDIRAGAVWKEQIGEALERATHLLFFASRASIASNHCDRELSFAIDNAKPVIPIFLEDVSMTPGLRVSLSRVQALVAHRLPADDVRAKLLAAITDDSARGNWGTTHPKASTRKRMYWCIGAAVAVAAAIGAFCWWRGWLPVASNVTPVADASVAVLRFVAMSDDPAMRHLGEAFAEEITNQLAGRPDLKVASRTSAFQATGDVGSIGRSLGVAFVLEGSVQSSGESVRLTAQLVRVGDGFHLWSETYDLPARATPIEQQDTLRTVGLTVDARVTKDLDLQRARAETRSDAAYAYYVKARRLRDQARTGGTSLPTWPQQVLDDVEAALAIDPDFVSALILRVDAYGSGARNLRWDARLRESRKSIDRALELAPNDPRSLLVLAFIQLQLELDPRAAEQTLERIRRINPHAGLYEGFARLALMRGQLRQALQYWQQGIDAAPWSSFGHYNYAVALVRDRDWDSAEREFNASIRLSPKGAGAVISTVGLISASVRRGDVAKANALFVPLWDEYQQARPAFLAYPLALLGRESEARALIDAASRDPDIDPYLCFLTYWALKRYDEALVWLRRGIDDRHINILELVRIPDAFPGLRDLPGYADIVAHLDSLQRSR